MPVTTTHVDRRTVLAGAIALGGAATVSAAPGAGAQGPALLVGRGIGDMTGEPLGAGMNGYASIEQISAGLHMRQRARAFVFADGVSGTRVALVTCEIGLMFQSIQQEVLRRLAARLGGHYHEGNVLLTATHTHVAPGGTSGHPMVDLSMGGFRPLTFESNVAGIVDAVVMAHEDLAPSTLDLTTGELTDASRNRSIGSFERDPQSDRDAFPGAIDPRSQTLRIHRGGQLVGLLNWFPTHATSLTKHTRACSTDNKGYASWYLERVVAGQDLTAPGVPRLVAAFAQSNPGDMSPNLDLRPGRGPTPNEFENCRIIGERQYRAAVEPSGPTRALGDGVDVRHTWVDMSRVAVRPEFTGGAPRSTAPAALGAAFAAGSTEDGGGGDDLPLREGEYGGNPIVAAVDGVVVPRWLRDAHAPKDVLIPCGLIPNFIQQVYPFHLVRIGSQYVFGLGFEPTVVAGLRLRRTIAGALDIPEDHVVIQGYTNAYGHYLTTPEEYSAQNYEGGATAFGPWQLPAVQQIAHDLAVALREGRPVDPGVAMRDLTGQIPSSPLGIVTVDTPPPLRAFGDVLVPPHAEYRVGEQVTVSFAGSNPNADLRRGGSYLAVERRDAGGWTRVHDDGDWSTTIWFDQVLTVTTARVVWGIPAGTVQGTYRIVYTASARGLDGWLAPLRGVSPDFAVR